MEANCILVGHVADPASVLEAMRAADLILLLSRTEGLPQVLVQAAAVGTPFVAYDVEGVRELLELGAIGDALPLNDLDAVVDTAERRLRRGPPADEPAADLSSWATEVIHDSYRTVINDVVGDLTHTR
jgi:glycosyltransferase involved in cell wall biosynthesis